MTQQKLEFMRASNAPIDNLSSFVLEAYLDGTQVADIFSVGGKWYVTVMTEKGLIRIELSRILSIIHRFSEFVIEENEAMIKTNSDKDEQSLETDKD